MNYPVMMVIASLFMLVAMIMSLLGATATLIVVMRDNALQPEYEAVLLEGRLLGREARVDFSPSLPVNDDYLLLMKLNLLDYEDQEIFFSMFYNWVSWELQEKICEGEISRQDGHLIQCIPIPGREWIVDRFDATC